MQIGIFTVLDKTVGAYLQPFYARSKAEAIRSFSDAVGNPEHQFSKHVDDYSLYHLGAFEDTTGVFAMLKEPERLVTGRECLNSA